MEADLQAVEQQIKEMPTMKGQGNNAQEELENKRKMAEALTLQKADLEDAEAMKRYASSKEKSDRFVKENVEKQEEAWNKIQDLERQLQKLGTERFEEVKRRIDDIDKEEKRRVVEFVARVRSSYPSLVISVDTWRAEVGRAVCEAGADVLNDAWGGADPELVDVAAEFDAALVCTHTGGTPTMLCSFCTKKV
jgi:hypothetical protein